MRVFNRLLLLVLGVALAAAGVLVVVEAVYAWTGSGFVGVPGRQWLATFKTTPWSAPIVIAISVAVAAAGLVLCPGRAPAPAQTPRGVRDRQWGLVIAAPLDRRLPATPLDRRGPRGRSQGAPDPAVPAVAAQGQGAGGLGHQTGPAERGPR